MARLTQEDTLPLKSDVGALANRINKATLASHNAINQMISLKMVFALRDPRIYRQGIQSFYHVFRTFEECWLEEMQKEGRVAEILTEVWTPAMARTEPLTKDLMFYYHDDKSKFETPIMTEQVDFAKHIRQVCSDRPHLILAYGHVMYLALFAGGRILRSNISRAAGLFPQVEGLTTEEVSTRGTNLFRFPEVDDEDAFRASYKSRYELATRNSLTEQEKKEIVEESQEIFRRNIACVAEIEKKNRNAMVQKIGYKAMKFGYYTLISILVIAAFYLFRRLVFAILP